jgi:hypothetical protein
MEWELDMLGIHGMFTRPNEKIEKKLFFSTQVAQIAIDQFLVSRNFLGLIYIFLISILSGVLWSEFDPYCLFICIDFCLTTWKVVIEGEQNTTNP